MAEAAPASGKGAESRERTAYHVLKQTNGATATYQLVYPNMVAANAEAAIRAYTAKVADDDTTLDGSGIYVAVPARSWKPVTVKTETKTVLTLT